MKMKFKKSQNLNWLLSALIVFGFASCKKLNSEGFTPGTGAPTITLVRTLSKSTIDSSLTSSVTTYNSSGVATTVTTPNYNPQLAAFDSTTVTGNLSEYYVIMGTNLGAATYIYINGVSIYFNRAWSSNTAIIFQIPTIVPYVQPQPNTIEVKTLYGSVTYKFTTLPPPPTIVTVSDFDFWSGSQISFTGKGFASISNVKLRATGDNVTVVSHTDTTLVLQFPHSTATQSTLLFTYTSGANTDAQAASTVTFNDLDNAYNIVLDNAMQNGWYANQWNGPTGIASGTSHGYGETASFEASYPAGSWSIDGFGGSIAYDPSYQYVSFWVLGGAGAETLALVGDKMAGGVSQNQTPVPLAQISVTPGVWSFYKIPLSAPSYSGAAELNFWQNGSPATALEFFLLGPNNGSQTIWFDEVAFLK